MRLDNSRRSLRRPALTRDAGDHAQGSRATGRSNTTRILHLLLVLSVLHQLISSQFISRPLPGDAPSTLFMLHEYIGLASFVLVFVFWIWTLLRHGETRLAKLFPWFSPRQIEAAARDAFALAQAMIRRDVSNHGSGDMASAVHGLGLLAFTGMAMTGTAYFLLHGTALARDAMHLHGALSKLMWIYLFGHAGMAALHHLLGSDILMRMFWIGRKRGSPLRSETAAIPMRRPPAE